MKQTKAELIYENARLRRANFYITTVIMVIWAAMLSGTAAFYYKQSELANQQMKDWSVTVTPAPEYQLDQQSEQPDEFEWPRTPIIDALNYLNPVTRAHAAPAPLKSDLPITRFDYPSPLKLWSIDQLATDRQHVACSATRSFDNGAIVSVTAYKGGTVELYIDKVAFMISEEKPYQDALLSVDGGTPVQTVAKREGFFKTSLDLSSMPLPQLANGKILRVTVNNLYVEFDLTGSSNAAKYVNACNASGQSEVYKRIVQAAQPATIQP